jgi:hypothetical protein
VAFEQYSAGARKGSTWAPSQVHTDGAGVPATVDMRATGACGGTVILILPPRRVHVHTSFRTTIGL